MERSDIDISSGGDTSLGKKRDRYIEWRGYEFRLDGKKRHRYIEWRGYEIDEKKQDGGDTLKIRVEVFFRSL